MITANSFHQEKSLRDQAVRAGRSRSCDADGQRQALVSTAAGRQDRRTLAVQLAGEPAATPWDPGLAAAMARHGLRIEEELCLDALLADLA